MAKNFKLNLSGLNELMKSEWMQGVLDEKAQEMVGGDGEYDFRTHVASYVALTNVYPVTKRAYFATLKGNELLKKMGG